MRYYLYVFGFEFIENNYYLYYDGKRLCFLIKIKRFNLKYIMLFLKDWL